MKGNLIARLGFVVAAGLLLIVSGCGRKFFENPLLVQIEDTVAVVVEPPSVVGVYPTEDSTDVAINTSFVTVTFTKNINPNTVTASSFYVVIVNEDDSETGPIAGTRETNNETLTFAPSDTLAYDTTYRVIVTVDVLDLDGNSLPEKLSWKFRTGVSPDLNAPSSPSITINAGATWTTSQDVTLTLNATDDRGVAQYNVSNTNSFGEGNWITVDEGDWPLDVHWEISATQGNHTVYVRYRDGADNLSATASDTIMLDSIVPTVTLLALDGGNSATMDQLVAMDVAGEDEAGGSGIDQFRIRLGVETVANGSLDDQGVPWLAWQDLTAGFGSIASQSIDPEVVYPGSDPLALDDTVTVEVQVRDVAGNVSVLAEEDEVGRRTIRWDQTAPSIVEVQPDDGATDVVVNAGLIQVTFDEEMDPTSFTDATFDIRKSGEVTSIGGTIGSADGGTALTISEISLEQNTDYIVRVLGTVTDVAGNQLGSDFSWFFSTSDAIDDTPPTGELALNTGLSATSTAAITLDITAEDDWNAVRAIKVWGDNDGSLPTFVDDASWQLMPNPAEINWTLSAGDGIKYIYYKFQDAALNENAVAFRLAVSLDTVDPTITSVVINGGDDYTNDASLVVSLEIDADDATSGLAEMRLSNDGTFNDNDPVTGTERWRPWSPIVPSWTIASGDGLKEVWVEVRDGVQRPSGTTTDTITLDLTPPSVVFAPADALNVNTATAQPGSLTDANGIGSYDWSQVSGTGTVTFSSNSIASPLVSANLDGVYSIRVDIVDNAGNAAFGTVEFTWDTTPPASIPVVSVPNYSTTSQPTWSWPAVSGADFYRVSFLSSPDWNNPADYTETNQTSFAPGSPLGEGNNTLRVTAWDDAGNSTGAGNDTVFVDTIPPAIDPVGQFFLTNVGRTIDYTGGDGDVVESGSGIASVLWEQVSAAGDGNLTISNSAILDPLVGATGTQGTYGLRLTVTDVAGNVSQSTFTIAWDTIAPGTPTVAGVVRTPDLTPTWAWESGGNGNGTFRWRINGAGWTETTDLSYTPGTAIGDGLDGDANETFVFDVQERDDADNWSIAGSFSTILDASFVAPPQISGSTLTNNDALTWNWSSGIGADSLNDVSSATDDDEYEYRIYDPTTSTWTGWSSRIYAPTASYTATDDGDYIIEVREYNTSGGSPVLVPVTPGSFTTTYDSTPPNPPSATIAKSTTNNTRPTYGWTSGGGGGIGRYWLGIDGSPIPGTQNYPYTSYTVDTLSEGTYNLQVRERDAAGNWSTPGSVSVTIDTTAPTLTSIIIDDPDAVGSNYAVDTTVNLSISYSLSGTDGAAEMRFLNSGGSWSTWESIDPNRSNWSLITGDGWKYVYVQLRDEAGNETSTVYDSILLDTAPPTVTSFSINGGATSTTSQSVTLNSNVSGASQMAILNGGSGTPSSWSSYSSARSWSLTAGYGGRNVRVKYRDAAGNETAIYQDAIHYGNPSLITATKGSTTNGSITASWTSYSSQVGTDYFYVYTATTPTGGKTSQGYSTTTSKAMSLTPGTLYYIFVRVYNSSIGWHDLYTPYVIGFSSNITVIYDANDSTDVAVANAVKSTLTTDWPNSAYGAYISGTMPSWSVTLVPETEISASWLDPSIYDDRYIIYGDPVIVTHGTSFYSYANKVRNVIHRDTTAGSGRKGVVAMGYGGLRMLDTAESYWSSWGYTDQAPVDIGYSGETYIKSDDTVYMYTWTSGNSVWSSPLTSTSLPTTNDTLTQITYSSGSGGGFLNPRYTIYRSDQSNPPGGWLYGRDYSGNQYFPVVRQGRFLHFGFTNMLIRAYTGSVYYVNLIARMDDY